MSFNNKKIAVSVAALLTAAGGIYAFMPKDKELGSDAPAVVISSQNAEPAAAATSREAASGKADKTVDAQLSKPTPSQQPATEGQAAIEAPKKLTKAQLTPPPATENEKLERAAEQESNF